jgi:penicillin-binding protein
MLTEQQKETISMDDFIAKNKSIYGGIEAKNIVVTVLQVSEDETYWDGGEPDAVRKTVEYTLRMDTLAGEISYANQAVFIRNQNKEYRMQWTTHTIFPGLNSDDKVWVKTLSATGGYIYDRNGEMLAGPRTASAIGFVPGKMRKEETALQDGMESNPPTEPESEAETQSADLNGATDIAESPPATIYNAEELEVLREQGCHMNSILGKAGIEKIYEDELRAVDGYEIIIVDSQGKLKETLATKEKRDGKDISLTIDAQIQNKLYDLFSTDKSCSVAMNPKTGEVLALVSTPTYDVNDFVLGMPSSKWTALNEDTNLPFLNRFKAAQCPGSTMKAITAAIAVNTGAVSPNDDFGHSGLKWRKDGSWGGYSITTLTEYNEPANIENALVYSDNIFFGKAALKIGADTFAAELKRIGFEERIPFEFGLYSSIVSSTETFTSEIQLADSGFGQGQILMNPIHLAAIYASFVNEGNILRPGLIKTNFAKDVWIENAFSPQTANTIKNGLIQVIERGTGKQARIPGVVLAGKTGTGEIKLSKDDTTGTELGWFVMFNADDNAENPLLVVTMVEDVKNRGGSHYVVPKIKTLFE